ncbi:MAG: insulinase family protein [Hahellaceae bacterium]|nr:insulinase family protein [Hahellaceae bacterium]
MSSQKNESAVSGSSSFTLVRTVNIPSLHVDAQEYLHNRTGARHLHLHANNDENVFLVALKTLPHDNTGVAHILEHTALCGSENYPVRDPFFMMIRRSLNTFMNAFTSSDWTAYPFASKNRKDFDNLLQVYLDSVFAANLDPMDFAQEGHRIEFSVPGDANSPLEFKGVVYNEMKGAMSAPVSQLWQTLTKYVFPTTTYHYNSGGDPEHIPDLTHDQLLAFYKKHYHPSNAVFLTYGNIPAAEHHERFEALALKRFDRQKIDLRAIDEKRYFAPIRVQESYPVSETKDLKGKTHLVMAWLLGHSFDLEENLEAHLLSNVLFENSAAPLQMALEKTTLGHSPSSLCGLEDSNREMTFMCGIEGSEVDCVPAFEQLVEDVLNQTALQGVAQDRLEAVLHQLELSQREISGDSYPYGLQLALSALSPMIHGGDALALLDLDPVLEKLREKIQDPQYFPSLVKRHLIDNPHRVTLSLAPDGEMEAKRERYIASLLEKKRQSLTDEDKVALLEKAEFLKLRQERKDDESILPKIGIEDIPVDLLLPKGERLCDTPRISGYTQGTNGIVYQQVVVDLPQLSERDKQVLPVYSACLAELGAGSLDYLQMQNRQSGIAGGVHGYFAIKGKIDDAQSISGYLVLSGKALERNAGELALLMRDIFVDARFDEGERIRELVAQMRAKREQSVTSSGHALAMAAASSGMGPAAKLTYELYGLAGIKALKELDDGLNGSVALDALLSSLQELHEKLLKSSRQFLVVGEQEGLAASVDTLRAIWAGVPQIPEPAFSLPPLTEQRKLAWIANSQVSFCAKAYPSVPVGHPDAAALTVLGGFLKNGFLHRVVREQGGAYGGGAGQDSTVAAFRFYSYRDPRMEETFADFDASLEWMQKNEHDALALEEAILGVIGQIDKPKSPAGEAKADFHSELFGRTAVQRRKFREQVLNVTIDDLKRVSATYLNPDLASIAVVTGPSHKEKAKSMGMTLLEL